jgi:cyclic pyranopterin phosphate synthase
MLEELTLNHFDSEGKAIMVDVSHKKDTLRTAAARVKVKMKKETIELIESGKMGKGDVLGVARIAGIMAAKKTSDLIPMCHPLFITGSEVNFNIDKENLCVHIEAIARSTGKTGVEMEALTAAAISALTIYDMCKAVDKAMVIEDIYLYRKDGGKSGLFINER